eukprot:TRINITY_DN9753_c0_g1_i1.p1 TRINITY_DN9753_c0_g1~~TRINITY_DN9753_c0_g1_i1.p1  ORF type:complete len:758 (+),score=139.38 TRINITY_DN9753_c0_g1_i1:144-2417(+)
MVAWLIHLCQSKFLSILRNVLLVFVMPWCLISMVMFIVLGRILSGTIMMKLVVYILINLIFHSEAHELYACGKSDYGQLGYGGLVNSPVPIKIPIDSAKCAPGVRHALVLDIYGDVYSFGEHGTKLGYHNESNQLTPKLVSIGSKAVDVFASGDTSFILTDNGSLLAFGDNFNGQLGIGDISEALPTAVDFGEDVRVVKVTGSKDSHTLVLDDNGTLYGFGSDNDGALGLNNSGLYFNPTILSYNVSDMAAGERFSVIVKTDGSVVGMGLNNKGQLGQGHNSNCHHPCSISMNSTIVSVETGDISTFLLDEDGNVFVFGGNKVGALGIPGGDINVPTKLISNISSMRTSHYHSLMITNDGDALVFGYQLYGRLCLNTSSGSQSTPIVSPFISGRDVVFYEAGRHATYFAYYGNGTTSNSDFELSSTELNTNGDLSATSHVESSTNNDISTTSQSITLDDIDTTILESTGTVIKNIVTSESTVIKNIVSSESTIIEIKVVDEDYEGSIDESHKDLTFEDGRYNNITNVTLKDSIVAVVESTLEIVNINTYETDMSVENSVISVKESVHFDKSNIILTDCSIVVDGDITLKDSNVNFDEGATISISGCLVIDGPTNIIIDANTGSGNIIEYDCFYGNRSDLNITARNLGSDCQLEYDISDAALSTIFHCGAARNNWWIYVIFGSVTAILILFLICSLVKYNERVRYSMNIIRKRQKDVSDAKLVMDSLNNLKSEIAITKEQVMDLEDLVNQNEMSSSSS